VSLYSHTGELETGLIMRETFKDYLKSLKDRRTEDGYDILMKILTNIKIT
jgi:hypothetical protein